MEEACCPVSLGDAAVTYFCEQDRTPVPIAYRWAEAYRPLLVWRAVFNLRRGPNRERIPVTMVNAVFRAAALGRPTPSAEMYARFLVDRETLLHTYAEPRPLGELLAMGAEVVGQTLPPETLLAPGGERVFSLRSGWRGRRNVTPFERLNVDTFTRLVRRQHLIHPRIRPAQVRDHDGAADDQAHGERFLELGRGHAAFGALDDVVADAVVAAQHQRGDEAEQFFSLRRRARHPRTLHRRGGKNA